MANKLVIRHAMTFIAKNFAPRAAYKLKAAGKRLYTFDGGRRAALNAYLAG